MGSSWLPAIKENPAVRDVNAFRENVLLALERVAREASIEPGPEEAMWIVTRTLPSLLGDPSAAEVPGNLPDGVPFATAATAFMLTPDGKHHLVTAPVNFAPGQHHEKVAIALGHPGHVAKTRHGVFLRNTSHHESFVKILQTFRAGSAIQLPMLWGDAYLGTLICACSCRNMFAEVDTRAQYAFAALAASLWMAHAGPAWLRTLDYSKLPERNAGT
jgi:hypothetical protein